MPVFTAVSYFCAVLYSFFCAGLYGDTSFLCRSLQRYLIFVRSFTAHRSEPTNIKKRTMDDHMLKIVLHYESLYSKNVTDNVNKWKKENKIIPTDTRIVLARDHYCRWFWSFVRSEQKNEPFVAALMKAMANRRLLKDRHMYKRMGFDMYGKPMKYDDFYEEDPLMHEKELFPTGIVLDVHIIHRNLCGHIPFCTMSQCSKKAGDALFQLHEDILTHIRKYNIQPRIDQAHKGWALLNTVTDGGEFSCDAENISGSIHWTKFFDEDVTLRNRAVRVFQEVILSAFGNCLWYQNLMSYLHNHENPHLSDRCVPLLPITNGWLSQFGQAHNYHVDKRNFGIALLVVPRTYPGGELVVTDPKFEYYKKIHLKQYDVVAGRSFRCYHYNLDCVVERYSYAFYFDYRMAHSGYIHMVENLSVLALKNN